MRNCYFSLDQLFFFLLTVCLWLIFANCLLRTHIHVWKHQTGLFEEDENYLWLDLCWFSQRNHKTATKRIHLSEWSLRECFYNVYSDKLDHQRASESFWRNISMSEYLRTLPFSANSRKKLTFFSLRCILEKLSYISRAGPVIPPLWEVLPSPDSLV